MYYLDKIDTAEKCIELFKRVRNNKRTRIWELKTIGMLDYESELIDILKNNPKWIEMNQLIAQLEVLMNMLIDREAEKTKSALIYSAYHG